MLKDFIISEIVKNGPMDMGTYMGHVLGHPQHGYYIKQDPFGTGGDFTTAPEISQIFGELIGAWVLDVWMKMGAPAAVTLLECGAGRGTLMADIVRVAAKVPAFMQACRVVLLETSPVLRQAQASALAGVDCRWIDAIDHLSDEAPVIVIGNEFLDALPVRQMVKTAEGWAERCVGVDGQDLVYVTQPTDFTDIRGRRVEVGEVVEISPAREGFMRDLTVVMAKAGGAGLMIDYGHDVAAVGDTLQAVYSHDYCGVLDHVGDADVSAHVDFAALMDVVDGQLAYQGAFLRALGGDMRAQILMEKAADPAQAKDIEAGYVRLVAPDQMGQLFKVMGWVHGYDFQPAGF